MHQLGSTENGVHRAGLYALGAANALILPNVGDVGLFLLAVLGIQWLGFDVQQICQRVNGFLSARGALVDGVAIGDRRGVGFTAWVPALAALGLRQQLIDLVHQRVAFGSEPYRGVAQHGTEAQAQAQQGHQGRQQRLAFHPGRHDYTSPAKPIKAREASPAVIIPIAAPWNGSGTSATARRSRMAANNTSTSENPTAAPKP